MTNAAQRRDAKKYGRRPLPEGVVRFVVIGLESDRNLIRTLAKKLAHAGPAAEKLREEVSRSVLGRPLEKGGILAALRRSPLVGADIDLTRSKER
jgi:hypothetical protein